MKKELKNIEDSKIHVAYRYALNDGTIVRKKYIDKRKKQFKQLYINTIKHEQDVRRWIECETRKKSDIRKSLEGLDSKYQELANLKKEYERNGVFVQKIRIRDEKYEDYDLEDLNDKIIDLYNIAGEKRKELDTQDIVEEKSLKSKILEMIPIKSITNKENKGNIEKKENKKEKKSFDFGKIGRRVASIVMAISMALFAGGRISNSKMSTNHENSKSYTNTDAIEYEQKNFKETIYVEAIKDIEEDDNNSENNRNEISNTDIKSKNVSNIDEESEIYIVKAKTKYTEKSDGSGNEGYFRNDNKVKVYNRALVKTDENGNKKIIEVTKIGQTWKEFAKEKNLNYNEFKEYMDNNKNIQKCVSLQSIDEEHKYGWVLEDTLEKIGEIER